MAIPLVVGQTATADDDPLGTIRYWEQQIKEVVHAPSYRGTPEDKELLKARIRSILDTERMGRLAVEKHWSKQPEADRREFLKLFRTLVERASVTDRKVDLFKLDNIRYGTPTVNGTNAEVKAHVRPSNEQVDVEVVYRLYRNGNGWKIYDLVIDEAGMIEGFRGQFNQIIAEDSFKELLNRMRKKAVDE
ncbi:MAG: ABC transporter substrate-binding protein [Nitrospirae bacterium]|nr:ABC transporter substrate-binding protein [Nitrospirota bacterium]